MKHIAFWLSFFVVLGCKSKTEQTTTDASDQEKKSQRITSKDIENLKYTNYVLSAQAKEAVLNWQSYQELMLQFDYMKKADLSFFAGDTKEISIFLNDLKAGIPETISTPAIKERLIALETKLLKLHSTLKLSNSSKIDTLDNIRELLIASSNLHLQINKKFELDSQVIEDPSIDDTNSEK